MEESLNLFDSVGRRLAAVLHRPEGAGTFPMVIISHGFMSHKGKYRKLSEMLEKEGIASIRFDFFGCGDSDGKFENITIRKMVENLRLVVKHAYDLYFVGAIGLFGSSMGGLVTLLQASQDSRIGALVLKAPVSDKKKAIANQLNPAKVKEWEDKGWMTIHDREGVGRKLNYSFYRDVLNYDVYKDAGRITCPALIVHGNKDSTVSLDQSKRLFGVLKSEEKDLQIIEGANHYFDKPGEREELHRLAVDWFRRHLK